MSIKTDGNFSELSKRESARKKGLLFLFLSTLLIFSSTPGLADTVPSLNTKVSTGTLPVKRTGRVDGIPSNAVISGGTSADGGLTTTNVVNAMSQVSINISITPESEHIGKTGNLVVVVNVGSAMLVLNHLGQWSPLSENNIPFFRSVAKLEQLNHLELFSGAFAESYIGEYNIFTGYLVDGSTAIGDIIYNVEPIILKVLPPPPSPHEEEAQVVGSIMVVTGIR